MKNKPTWKVISRQVAKKPNTNLKFITRILKRKQEKEKF